MGFDKVSASLLGKPVYQHSLETFLSHEDVSEVIVLTRSEKLAERQEELEHYQECRALVGGPERAHSVLIGLESAQPQNEWVAVHDAARPLLRIESLELAWKAAKKHGAASLASPVTDTLKQADEHGHLGVTIPREHLWAMQTPQIARRQELLTAYREALKRGDLPTDESSALLVLGIRTKAVAHAHPNWKLTYPHDLKLAEAWLGL